MSKPKANAKLLFLPEEQQAKLAEWLLGGMPYHQARELVEKEFGVKVSLGVFTSFWELVCTPMLLAKRRRMAGTASDRAEEAADHPAQFDAATLDALKQRAYELAEAPHCDPKDVKAIMMLLLKAQDQDFKNRQLTLEKDKFQFEAAKAALKCLPALRKVASDNSLNETDKIQAARQLVFGEAAE